MSGGTVTTSLIIQFESSSDNEGMLVAEIDDRADGFNKGNTRFRPGDSPVFLLYKTSNVNHTIDTTSGDVSLIDTGVTEESEILTLANETEKSLSKPPQGGATLNLLAGTAPGLTLDGGKIVTSEPALAVVKVTYNAFYYAYRLSNVPLNLGGETSFPVVIFINGTFV